MGQGISVDQLTPLPIVIGVAGGTASGKTTVSEQILACISPHQIAFLQHDSYYREESHLSLAERATRNYDHPQSLDTPLLVTHLLSLRRGEAVDVPIYDFATYSRRAESRRVDAAPVVLVEGILIFAERALRELMDIRIFVDTDADIRFIRRLRRDMFERGRSLDSVVEQYLKTVRPMHLEFVEPSKRYANVIVPEGGRNQVAMEMIISRVQKLLDEAG
ncbi:MAG: uridine kinase [Caldilineaceae bacterium]|nr:uridine kinase [Caldilineaceae bacterium]